MKRKWSVALALVAGVALSGCRATPWGTNSQFDVASGALISAPTAVGTSPRIQSNRPTARQVGYRQLDTQLASNRESVIQAIPQSAQTQLTLAELEKLAFDANPAIAELSSKIESLKGKLTQAGLPPNPTVGISGQEINENGDAGRYGVFLGREIVRGNKLGLSQSVVCAEIQAAEQRLAIIQQKLQTDIRQRYYDLLVVQEKVAVATKLMQLTQQAVDTSQKLFEAKEAAQTAVLQSELELQNATVIKRQAENERLAASRRLAGLLGKSELPLAEVAGDVHEIAEVGEFEKAFDDLVNHSPEIAALFAEVEQAKRQFAREIAEPIPNVTWQTTFLYDIAGDDLIAGFQVGMPIPTANWNQGKIYQAQQQINVAQHKAEKRALDLRQRLAGAYESYLDAKLQVDAYQTEILPKAQQTFELISLGYGQGEIDFLQLLTAQRTYSQINLAYLDKLRQLWRQNVEISGMLLKGSLD